MATVASLHAIEILDSRGNPTLQVSVRTDQGIEGVSAVPSGASTGIFEALELRDQDPKRYGGKGVKRAIEHVQGPLQDLLKGRDVREQRALDALMVELDGTENKSRLGANAILGVSLALARAGALTERTPLYRYLCPQDTYILPCPMMNVINGGMHADNCLDIQEFMIRPKGACSFASAVQMGAEVFHQLKKLLKEKGCATSVGDEGGFAPNLSSTKEALDLMMKAIEKAGYRPEEEITLALDLAASSFYDEERHLYVEKKGSGKMRNSEEQVELLCDLVSSYPIDSIEDGMAEGDWAGWQHLTQKLGKRVQLVGDDNFVTNKVFLQKGIDLGVANAILIKVNQIGTLTEAMDCMRMASEHGYASIVSHRSGETEDTTIADLSVAMGCGEIKTGSLSRSDRVAKYNRLLTIEDELKAKGVYRDGNPFSRSRN